jgi:transcriptional regulator with XRE-family HTH domain
MAFKHPTSADILAAREKAGLTQAQAAELVHLAHRVRWTEYENGTHAIDLARWELFLVKTAKQRARKT